MDSVQGRNGFALNFDFAQLPVDPMNLPEKPQISGPCALGLQSDDFFRPLCR